MDDDPDGLALVAEILESAGATVETVASVRKAIDCLAQLPVPDVLLSDVGMPGMEGLELISRVRHAPHEGIRTLPAIALTAYARSEDLTAALDRGYQLHLAKPVSPADLVAAVRAVTGGSPQLEGSA